MAAERRLNHGNGKRLVIAMLRSAAYLVVVPGVFVGLVPWWMSRWRLEPPLLGFSAFRVIGVLLNATEDKAIRTQRVARVA
jgi:hypothetical protein